MLAGTSALLDKRPIEVVIGRRYKYYQVVLYT